MWPPRERQDVDPVKVERFLGGDTVTLNRLERREVVRQLTESGMSAQRIGERLGVTTRSAQRLRQRLRLLGAMPTASRPWWVPGD